MAINNITLTFIMVTIFIWLLLTIVIFKLFCDRHKELKMIKDIAAELKSVKMDIKSLK
jgi:hypothetical protein